MSNKPYIELTKQPYEYTATGWKSLETRARNQGKPLKTLGGALLDPSPIETPEQVVNDDAGRNRDARKIAQSLNISGLTSMAPSLHHSNVGGNPGFFGMQKPYITIINKQPIGTEDLDKYIGFPLEAKKSLSQVTGYTEVSHIHIPDDVSNSLLTVEEQEIRSLLSGGVIF